MRRTALFSLLAVATLCVIGCNREPEIPPGMTLKNPMGTKPNGEPASPPVAKAPTGPAEAQEIIAKQMPGQKR